MLGDCLVKQSNLYKHSVKRRKIAKQSVFPFTRLCWSLSRRLAFCIVQRFSSAPSDVQWRWFPHEVCTSAMQRDGETCQSVSWFLQLLRGSGKNRSTEGYLQLGVESDLHGKDAWFAIMDLKQTYKNQKMRYETERMNAVRKRLFDIGWNTERGGQNDPWNGAAIGCQEGSCARGCQVGT